MGYPMGPGPYGPPPGQQPPPGQGQGYPQGPPQQPQGGYAPQGYAPQPPPQQGGYAPFQGAQGGGQAGSYDWGSLYGQADHSVGQLIDAGMYDAIVKESSWDRTKDGTKGAWTVQFILTSGPRIGMKLTTTMTVSPQKNDGTQNAEGMGILFRQLGAMGIPVPPNQPWWTLGWAEPQVAQAMVGRPVLLQVTQNEWDGVTRNKVRDIQPPRPGAPTQLPQPPQQQVQGGWQQPQGQPQPGQAPTPWQQPQGAPQGYQQGPPQGYPQQGPPPGWQPAPGQPPYAQPAAPGQPGAGQFTPQGQAFQPGTDPAQTQQAQQAMQQPWGNGYPQQPAQQGPPPPQGEQQGPPTAPGWAQ